MQEGIEIHLSGMQEDGLAIPEPTTLVDYAEGTMPRKGCLKSLIRMSHD